jgi:translation initiation factor 3 subunit G
LLPIYRTRYIDEFQGSDTIDANGVRTVVEYKTNEEGKRVKVRTPIHFHTLRRSDQCAFLEKITKRIKRTLKTSMVDHVVAERKQWAKFGADKGKKPGLDNATTTVAERVDLKLSAGNKGRSLPVLYWSLAPATNPLLQHQEVEVDESAQMKEKLGTKKIMCRLCKGDHFTSKCPHRAVLAPLAGEGTQVKLLKFLL